MEQTDSDPVESRTDVLDSIDAAANYRSSANEDHSGRIGTSSDNESCLSTEEQYDSLLAESLIRVRTELLRNESTSQNSGGGEAVVVPTRLHGEESSDIDGEYVGPPTTSLFRESASLGSEKLHEALANSTSFQNVENERALSQSTATLKKDNSTTNIKDERDTKSTSVVSVNSNSHHNDDISCETDPTVQSNGSVSAAAATDGGSFIEVSRVRNHPNRQHPRILRSYENTVPITAFSVPAPQRAPVVAEEIDTIETNSNNNIENAATTKAMWRYQRMFLALFIVLVTATIVGGTVGGLCASGKMKCGGDTKTAPDSENDDIVTNGRVGSTYNFIESISAEPNETDTRDAMKWVIEDDPLEFATLNNNTFRILQRYALATLYFYTTTEDSKWKHSTNWLSEEDECNWHGIICADIEHLDYGFQSTVINIEIQDNNLKGRLPADLTLLSKLRLLDLSYNQMSGTLSNAIGQWTDLTVFKVEGNTNIGGTIPESIGNMTNLTFLELGLNMFSGTLPVSLGYLTNLNQFHINDNRIRSTIPTSFGMLTDIETVHLAMNHLFGQLPKSIGNWTSLSSFDASMNDFTGTLPNAIGIWTNLLLFSIHGNEFSGTIPDEVLNWDSVESFYVFKNNFTGSIPFETCPTSLKSIEFDCSVTSQCMLERTKCHT